MKKYRVSIAAKVPINYEVEDIEASSPEEARKLALQAYYNGTGYFDTDQPLIDDAEIDEEVESALEEGKDAPGIYTAEVDPITNQQTEV